MPVNKNALKRYLTIDRCLRDKGDSQCTLDDLVRACSDALGVEVSKRTVQGDIETMRHGEVGYNAPIVVYNRKYYKYTDEDFSITKMPLSPSDCEVMQEAVDMLRQLQDFGQFAEISELVSRVQEKLSITGSGRKPIIHIDSVPGLNGLRFLSPLYGYIANRQTVRVSYKPFMAQGATEYILYPYLLKEFRNRWFLFGSRADDMKIFNLPLDRIQEVETVAQPYRENGDFKPEEFFNDVIGVSKSIDSKPQIVRFWASASQSKYIKTKPVHKSQKLIDADCADGGCVFEISVVENFELYSVMMSYGPGVKILSPENIVDGIKKYLAEASALYD